MPAAGPGSGKAFGIAVAVAAVVHLALLAIEFTQPEPQPSPTIELALDAPRSDRTRDAGRRLDQPGEKTPTNPALAGKAGPDDPTEATRRAGAGHRDSGAGGTTETQRPVPTRDRIDRIRTEINAALRTGYVTSRTRSGPEGRYLARWKRRVEVYGNRYYPRALIEANLSGAVVLEATIDRNGKVLNLAIRRSSGSTTLDNAARNLLQAASPYPAFPPELAERRDRLVITRTWVFTSDRQVFDRSTGRDAIP
jgi:protein TonB